MTAEDIRNNIEGIDSQIRSLHNDRVKLEKQLKELQKQESLKKIDEWRLTTNRCLVLFSKSPLFHIITAVKILSVDYDDSFIECLSTFYTKLDDVYSARSEKTRISFQELFELQERYNIYFVGELQMLRLRDNMVNINIKMDNIEELEKEYSMLSTLAITS